ncbi:MAG: DUF4430 domain-containing protein [Oscillospiraceae bacterium]|nr:DUF4430 domain-containing protein [Oscillospiraceae bacterium]
MLKTRLLKSLSFILCIVLIAAMALFATGCNGNTQEDGGENQAQPNTEATVLGEGETVFDFVVVDKDGNETKFEIHTNKTVVGEALLDLELIAGDEGEFGLYVKTVNGITADYEVDGTYWAFYINGEYAITGVDSTPITDGEVYTFKVE